MRHMEAAFLAKKALKPEGVFMRRLQEMVDALTLRRPDAVISDRLPPCNTLTVKFRMSAEDMAASDAEFAEFVAGNNDRFAHLAKANQIAYHPALPELTKRKADADEALGGGIDQDGQEIDDGELSENAWRWLSEERRYRSGRVDAIIQTYKRQCALDPHSVFLIVDESTTFLHIVQIALEQAYRPPPIYRFDGRKGAAERSIVKDEFFRAQGRRVMLATRATGGEGLNLQCAHVLIRCGPWWNASWERRAAGQVYRPGATKPVTIYELNAERCAVENHLKKVRDSKAAVDDEIISSITRADNAPLEARSIE